MSGLIRTTVNIEPVHRAMMQAASYNASDGLRKILDAHAQAARVAKAYFAGQVSPNEAMVAMGALLLDRLAPAPAGGNGGDAELQAEADEQRREDLDEWKNERLRGCR